MSNLPVPNPYSAPAASGYVPPRADFDATATAWEPGEVVSIGWERFKENIGVWIGALMLGLVIYMVPLLVTGFVIGATAAAHGSRPDGGSGQLIGGVLGLILGSAVYAGVFTLAVSAARGEAVTIGTFFGGMGRLGGVILTSIVATVAILVGFLLLIVPGVILALGLSQAIWFAVDKQLGPLEALKSSWQATSGQKGKIFVLGLLCFGVVILGELACGVGVLAAIPVVLIAQAAAYLRLSAGVTPSAVPAPI